MVTSARNKPQTSSCYIRSLRAIYNKAVARRRVKDRRPFRNVFTGNDRTVKRSIDNTDLCRLYSLQLPKASHLCLARDLFLFSFYAMGMPLIDIAHLRRSDIKSGYIVYNRHKTGRQVRVKIEKCMEDLLCPNGETATAHSPDDYLFPILNQKKHPIPSFPNEQQCMASYASFLSYYNRTLKHLARLADITAPLTSYTPRHTWASLAYRNNVELPVISKALGHTNPTALAAMVTLATSCSNDENVVENKKKSKRQYARRCNGIYISRKHHKHNNPHFDAQPYLQNRWRLYVGG